MYTKIWNVCVCVKKKVDIKKYMLEKMLIWCLIAYVKNGHDVCKKIQRAWKKIGIKNVSFQKMVIMYLKNVKYLYKKCS